MLVSEHGAMFESVENHRNNLNIVNAFINFYSWCEI